MVTRHACPHCGKIGTIRAERVIKAGNGITEFVCGACAYTWQEKDVVAPPEEQECES